MTTRSIVPGALALLLPLVSCSSAGSDTGSTPVPAEVGVPDSFEVAFRTSAGDWTAMFHRSWSPRGVERVWELVGDDVWAGARFYRVNPRVVQFGATGDPAVDRIWRERTIEAEPVVASNRAGRIAFARSGPDTRTFQLFVNRVDNAGPTVERYDYDVCCDGGFPPVGEIRSGMSAFESINGEYGEAPDQDSIRAEGNRYLVRHFPRLDSILGTRILRSWR